MKSLKKTTNQQTKYLRVSDIEVDRYINQGYSLCSKSEWKLNMRDVNKESAPSKIKNKK